MENEVDSRLVSHRTGNGRSATVPLKATITGRKQLVFTGAGGQQLARTYRSLNASLPRPARLANGRSDDLLLRSRWRRGSASGSVRRVYHSGYRSPSLARGRKVPMKQHCPHPDLLRVDPFEGSLMKSWSRDILYIPPGFPHEGYSPKTR